MDKRSEALYEALEKNDEEVERWMRYVKENEIGLENLESFSKRLTVEVMVPFGSKAFFPGRLKHTNEILVGHSKDYFSHCSAHTAMEICKKRIEHGKEYLKMLEAEREMFQNKLDLPQQEGVFPNLGEREIIEEYDEEKEKLWMEEHKKRVKAAKLKEKQEREEMLKQQENQYNISHLMEEYPQNELSDGEDEIFRETEELTKKLMCSEICAPQPKVRIAYSTRLSDNDSNQLEIHHTKEFNHDVPKAVNSDCIAYSPENIPEEIESDVSDSSDVPEEIRTIVKQAEYLPPSDRLGFYGYQIQIIEQRINKQSFNNINELEEKLTLFKIRDHLEELIEMHEEELLSYTDAADDELLKGKENNKTSKKRISFAQENKTLEFRKNECVTQMLAPNSKTKDSFQFRDLTQSDNTLIDLEKKAENVHNNIVGKLIDESIGDFTFQYSNEIDKTNKVKNTNDTSPPQTLYIKFKHSTQESVDNADLKLSYPTSPKDVYEIFYLDRLNMISKKENPKKHNTSRTDRSNELTSMIGQQMEVKSILKNKLPTKDTIRDQTKCDNKSQENSDTIPSKDTIKGQTKGDKKSREDRESSSSYDKVMGEVVENTADKPDPLPDGKFIDVHTPKKRVSRFKNMRSGKSS